jgi:hypothetical protein
MNFDFPVVKNEPARYQPTSHGGRTLIDSNNYTYIKSKSVQERIYWFCQRARSKMLPYCPAKALTVTDTIKWTSAHNHGSDPVSVEVKAVEKKILQVSQCGIGISLFSCMYVCMYLCSTDSTICRERHHDSTIFEDKYVTC